MFTSHGCAAPTIGRGKRSEVAAQVRPKVGATRRTLTYQFLHLHFTRFRPDASPA